MLATLQRLMDEVFKEGSKESKEKEKCGENAIAMKLYAIVKICDCMRLHEAAVKSHDFTFKCLRPQLQKSTWTISL